jgi:hypothetical protein
MTDKGIRTLNVRAVPSDLLWDCRRIATEEHRTLREFIIATLMAAVREDIALVGAEGEKTLAFHVVVTVPAFRSPEAVRGNLEQLLRLHFDCEGDDAQASRVYSIFRVEPTQETP